MSVTLDVTSWIERIRSLSAVRSVAENPLDRTVDVVMIEGDDLMLVVGIIERLLEGGARGVRVRFGDRAVHVVDELTPAAKEVILAPYYLERRLRAVVDREVAFSQGAASPVGVFGQQGA